MDKKITIGIVGAGIPNVHILKKTVEADANVEVTIMKSVSCGKTESIIDVLRIPLDGHIITVEERMAILGETKLEAIIAFKDIMKDVDKCIVSKPKKRGKYWERKGFGGGGRR